MTRDPWLSEVMGHAVWSVDGPGEPAPAGPAMLQARIPAERVDLARDLCAEGFYPVDMALTLRRGPEAGPAPAHPLRTAAPGDRDAVAGVSARAMTTSRFSLDPAIPAETAARVKGEWAGNCVTGARGVGVTVAEVDGEVAGFLAVIASGDRRVIDLVAVDEGFRGRGLGRALVADFVRRHGPGSAGLAVATQAGNAPSLALYESLGFRVAEAAWVLHRHVSA